MAKITMFAFDSLGNKRFNRYHLEDFVEQPNCSVELWNQLKEKVDKQSYTYTIKDNKMEFQVGRIQQPITNGFVVIWGYGLNDNDVNEKEFKDYVNNICKKGVVYVNEHIEPEVVEKIKKLTIYDYGYELDMQQRGAGSSVYIKRVNSKIGLNSITFNMLDGTVAIFITDGSELTRDLREAILNTARTKQIFTDDIKVIR